MVNAKGWGKIVLGLSCNQVLHKPMSKTSVSVVTDARELTFLGTWALVFLSKVKFYKTIVKLYKTIKPGTGLHSICRKPEGCECIIFPL